MQPRGVHDGSRLVVQIGQFGFTPEVGDEMSLKRYRYKAWALVIAGLLMLAFCLGLPQFHYAVALMIAVIVRYKDAPLNEPLFRLPLAPERS